MGWGVLIISLSAHIVYFTVDQCASEMETPFGDDMNDIDIDKHIRRIDKHSAALLSIFAESPIVNFDLFPETRSTNVANQPFRRKHSIA
jgi:predicted membrane chloride channel (bestrophin family)